MNTLLAKREPITHVRVLEPIQRDHVVDHVTSGPRVKVGTFRLPEGWNKG